jgi:hypothetical protein
MKLESVNNRVICLIDTEQKNFHTFSNGAIIRHERNWNNFDKKHTEQVLGTVISADDIPEGALVLLHHNSTHDVNLVNNHGSLSGEDIASGLRVYSVPVADVYLWKREGDEWMPCEGFAIAERVFEPYKGVIQNIQPKKLKDTLYVKTGEYAGLVVRTLTACDYEIIFREPSTGRERRIIRFRPNGDEKTQREPEAIAIDHSATEKVKRGEFFLGLTPSDAKPINYETCLMK